MTNKEFDVVIIGGGPGGYVAAIRASQLGLKAALVEQEHLGGICLNWGCIPTKALLRSAEVGHLLSNLEEYGFTANDVQFDIRKIVKRSRNVSKQLSEGVAYLLKKNKVAIFEGTGRLNGAGKVQIKKDGKILVLKATHIILATGARARDLPGLQPDGKSIWTYKEAMVPEKLPKSLLVIGSGAIGIEFASFYRDLGSEVTVVEVMDRILPAEDAEISGFAQKAFENQGMTFHVKATVQSLTAGTDGVTVSIQQSNGETITLKVERVILAIGITGNVEAIGLEETKVRVDNGHIKVDQWMWTGEPGVYAIGDLVGPPWLAHKASHEAVLCVERIVGIVETQSLNTDNVPACTYCRPQVASIGITEEVAKANGRKVRVGRFSFKANGKAVTLGETDGLVKTVFDAESGELLGAHMVGAEVTELIHGFAVAKTLETTELDLLRTIFPHPTLSEIMHESVLDAYDKAIHI
ncbi:MAG TPA: dihydrolipoyl dehydrogenase [Alphaproteobacteria bacterium]|nr:dihydrolipoyl dehydrogenase [Alphaproteobacteria bacterium]